MLFVSGSTAGVQRAGSGVPGQTAETYTSQRFCKLVLLHPLFVFWSSCMPCPNPILNIDTLDHSLGLFLSLPIFICFILLHIDCVRFGVLSSQWVGVESEFKPGEIYIFLSLTHTHCKTDSCLVQIVCVSVSGRASELELSPNVAQERYNLKWSAPYNEIEIVDGKLRILPK